MPGMTSIVERHLAPGRDAVEDAQGAVVERRVAPDEERSDLVVGQLGSAAGVS